MACVMACAMAAELIAVVYLLCIGAHHTGRSGTLWAGQGRSTACGQTWTEEQCGTAKPGLPAPPVALLPCSALVRYPTECSRLTQCNEPLQAGVLLEDPSKRVLHHQACVRGHWREQKHTGWPRHTGHTCVFGSSPYKLLQLQKALVCVLSWT